jgi:hypothetical protein
MRTIGIVGLALVLSAVGAAKLRHRHRREARSQPAANLHGRQPPRSDLIVGYNLDFPGDWSDAMPFLDLMHDARPWEGVGAGDKYAGLDLDEHGWPRSLGPYSAIVSFIRTGDCDGFVGKVWVVSYRGEGELTVDGAAEVLDRAPGRIRFRGRPDNAWITIHATDPRHTGNHLRDITIVREDRQKLVQTGQIFNPDLLAFLAPYKSLRFMDWMLSNEKSQEDAGRWSERSTTAQPQWRTQFIDPKHPARGLTATGYPVEVMVALANTLHAHPHFNLPYKYDDDYARQFAILVRKLLAPGLVATVEYSNEVWNWGFPQATYARLEAQKLWPGEGTGWLQYMGMRASNICRIWKQVFAGDRQRMRCVIAPQTGWPDVASASLDCPRWVAMGHEPCYRSADAIAITGYFNGLLPRPENKAVIASWLAQGEPAALTKAFRQLEHGDVPGIRSGDGPASPADAESLDGAIAMFGRFRKMADLRGLGLYVYEGGTHFDAGKEEPLHHFLVDMTRDPRMTRLYVRLFDAFAAAGGSVFNVWGGIGRDSAWANGTDLLDRTHPKYRAVLDFEAQQAQRHAAR